MEIKNLSNERLIEAAVGAIQLETTSTTNVVRHFLEIYYRDLHLLRGYPSMFLMAVNLFGYDKASAQRRVNAMELSIAVPRVLELIDAGELCLQSAADIQTFLNKERGVKRNYSIEEKRSLVDACAGLSTRDVQVELAKRNPNIDFRESKKVVAADRVQVTHTLSQGLEEKLERIKQLRSHVNPYMNREELLEFMAEYVLDGIDPLRKADRAERRRSKREKLALVPAKEPANEGATTGDDLPPEIVSFVEEVVSEGGEIQLVANFEEPKRYIEAQESRAVHLANSGRGCEYVDPKTGRRCGSQHQLQRDHIVEYSKGGSNRRENLRLLCAQHNRFTWRQRSVVRAPSVGYAC